MLKPVMRVHAVAVQAMAVGGRVVHAPEAREAHRVQMPDGVVCDRLHVAVGAERFRRIRHSGSATDPPAVAWELAAPAPTSSEVGHRQQADVSMRMRQYGVPLLVSLP